MMTIAEILKEIEAYCASEGIAETTFGKRVVNDGKFVRRLRDGGSINLKTYSKLVDVFEKTKAAA